MREYTCPYDENVLIRIVEPLDGMAYIYARQLFNEHGGAVAVANSKDPAVILLDSDIVDDPHADKGRVNGLIAKQLSKIYMPVVTDKGASQLGYRIAQKQDDEAAAAYLRKYLIEMFQLDPEADHEG